MTIAIMTVMLAGLMPILWVAYAKRAHHFKMSNNGNPRDFMLSAQGKSQRANWAQMNSWEAFAPFAAAVIISMQSGVEQTQIDHCGLVFIAARFIYGLLYIFDKPTLRSCAWFVAIGANLALYYFVWAH